MNIYFIFGRVCKPKYYNRVAANKLVLDCSFCCLPMNVGIEVPASVINT